MNRRHKENKNYYQQAAVDQMIKKGDTIGLFLDQIPDLPPLSAQDNIRLGLSILQGKKADKKLAANERLTEQEQATFSKKSSAGKAAQHELVEHCLSLAFDLANKFSNRNFLNTQQRDDALGVANIALVKVASYYDYRRGAFTTLATFAINQELATALPEIKSTLITSKEILYKSNKITNIINSFRNKNGRTPSINEILAEAGYKYRKNIFDLLTLSSTTIDLDAPVRPGFGDDDQGTIGDFITNPQPDHLESIIESEMKKEINDTLFALSARDSRVLRSRLGFYNGIEQTVGELGSRMGRTHQRVTQIEKEALKELRKSSRAKRLKEYLE